MITCESFRARFHEGTEDAGLLEHIRSCDRCLDFAATIDPDIMFRALGGEALVPPGGIDAFVDDVMQQVRVRGAESAVTARRTFSWPRRLAVAATIAAGLSGAMFFQRATTAPVLVARRPMVHAAVAQLTTKPVIETYESQNATIVEVPTESADDVKIVMIFDENLPADL